MGSIRVSSDPFGRAIKRTLEHLQRSHSGTMFGYHDLPELEPDYLAEATRKVALAQMRGTVVLESAEGMANSSILKELQDAGLIETTGYKEFRLTAKGSTTTVHF